MTSDKITDTIIKRILSSKRAIGISDLLDGKIEPTDLLSLLLRVFEGLARRTNIKKLTLEHNTNRLVQPCDISQRELLRFDNLIYGVISDNFSAIEFSPVNPLGLNSTLARTSQKNVLSTIRNVEVIADITAALAIECAKKRRAFIHKNPTDARQVHLCSSHRSIRAQKFPENIGFTPHFRAFGACTGGRDEGHEKFESENLILHVSFYLDIINQANQSGYHANDVIVCFSDMRITEALIRKLNINREDLVANTQTKGFDSFGSCKNSIREPILSAKEVPMEWFKSYGTEKSIAFLSEIEKKAVSKLRKIYPFVNFHFDLSRVAGIGYYETLCFKITARNKNGESFPLADGGLTDWTKKLLANKKERLFIGGFGSELFCRNFKG